MSASGSFLAEISKLNPGDHLCCIYETDEEHRALLTPYLRQGLERNEKVVYIVDARTAETVLEYLRQDGIETRPFLDTGQLVVLSVAEAYMRGGTFDPGRMISLLRREADRARSEGYRALRATGEMSWALKGLPGSERLIEYESKPNNFFPGSGCIAVCQYDRRRFPPSLLLQVLATHPIAVIGTEIYENFHFVPPEMFLVHDFSTATLNHWIEGLRIRRRAKAGEDALRESEEQFRAVFENSMDGILVTTPDGGVLAANPAACGMLGRTEAEVCRAGRAGVVAPSDPRLPVLLEERARTGMYHGELIFVRKGGTKFPVEISSRVYRDRYGHPRTSMIFRDITDRRRTEEALRESEAKYRLLVENATDAIWIAQDGVVKFSNPTTARITGYSSEELARMPFLDLVHPEDRNRVDERHRGRLEGEVPPGTCSFRARNKAGEELWCQLSATRIEWEGRPATLNFVRDITPQKKLESQLLASQKMEAVGRLAGGIAHDFNNLLTATIGYCDLALGRIDSEDPLGREIREIRKASERCAMLTQQLLAFSRKRVMLPKVINLNDVVAAMDSLLRRLIGEDIALVSVPGKGLGNVKVDPGQIEQVIANLAVNARDAMPKGGKLTIETANVGPDDLSAREHEPVSPGSHVMLAVSDTGCGMDEGTRARIFEPFFTTKEKGTGLGLSTVYGIVRQSGGTIDVHSGPGVGTTFRICFPRVSEEVTAISEPDVPPLETLQGNETILLVEDEEMVRELVQEILVRYGYDVLDTGCGREAVEACSRHRGTIHLMLTDVVLPDISGVELSKRLAPMRPDMKMLFMSGYAGDAMLQEGIPASGVPFLQKPVTVDSLVRKIREVLDSKSTTH